LLLSPQKIFLQANEVKIACNFHLIRLFDFPFALVKGFSGTSHENLVPPTLNLALTWQDIK
jgi:hypothetical protein